MRQLSLFFILMFFVSCNQKAQMQDNSTLNENMQNSDSIYAVKLINSDFLKFADHSKIDSLKIQLKKSFDIFDVDNFKVVHIDAEELAEFSFDFFLPQLNKMLGKRNTNLTVKTANDYEKTNDIIINGEKINLYTKIELDNSTFWDKASRNFFKKANEILKAKKIDEQFFLIYNGNDLQALLLTEEQFCIISEYYKKKRKGETIQAIKVLPTTFIVSLRAQYEMRFNEHPMITLVR
jgi:hypothetical protein